MPTKRLSLALCCTFLSSILTGHAALAASPQNVSLSPAESAYLQKLGPIKMCVDPDWAPFERINAEGKHEGISADLVQLVAQRLGVKIELYPVRTWEESLAASKANQCHIMSFLNQTPARDAWLIFTQPIFFDQNVIITREEHPYIGDLQWMSDKTVALPRGTMVEERIRKAFPGLTVITTSSEDEAIRMVSERKADLTVRSLIVAAYAIKKQGLFNLKIAGQVPDFVNQLRMGVNKNNEPLRAILDKGVATITPQDRETIANRHVSVNVQTQIDTRLVWQIGLISALIILVVVLWNRKLTGLNQELARLSVTDKLTKLFNRQKLDAELEMAYFRAMRFGQPLSVILLDIDHFKEVNDQHGHQVGDQVLVHISDLLSKHIRKIDLVGRWGGEEFMIICAGTDSQGAATLAELLRELIEYTQFPTVGHKTASFGVASFQPNDQVNTIVSRADAALYEAKHKGRNQVVVK